MCSELPEFTRTHRTVAMPPGCRWAGQNCGIWKFSLPGWYCIVTQRDFHTNKSHELLHNLERSIGLESIRLIQHGSESFIIGLLGLDALYWVCGFSYLVYFFYTCRGWVVGVGACLLVATGTVPHSLSSQTSCDAPHASKTLAEDQHSFYKFRFSLWPKKTHNGCMLSILTTMNYFPIYI